jgi:hypothetical protein
MILRVADRFGTGIDGAMHHLGYPPPSPRQLRQWTLWCMDAALAEGLYHKWQSKPEKPDFTPDEARWFKTEITDAAWACPGCGQMPGTFHLDGCPDDPEGHS